MSISGITENEYAKFLEYGGTISVFLDKTDLKPEELEEYETIKPHLYTGFEIPPSTVVVDDPGNRAIIYFYGQPWDRTIAFIYGHGGKIIYKKMNNEKYQAKIILPERNKTFNSR